MQMKIRSKIGSDLGPKMVQNRRDNALRLDHMTSLGTLRNEMNRGAFLGSVAKMAKSDPSDESSRVVWGSGLSRFRGLPLACSIPSL